MVAPSGTESVRVYLQNIYMYMNSKANHFFLINITFAIDFGLTVQLNNGHKSQALRAYDTPILELTSLYNYF